jgi:hypothetical protein
VVAESGPIASNIERTTEPEAAELSEIVTSKLHSPSKKKKKKRIDDVMGILGQDWLEKAGYGIQKKIPDTIAPYSERLVKCKTSERGVRFIEHQLLQPGLIAATSLVECKQANFHV